jgi:CRP-like cAMP-binding protein
MALTTGDKRALLERVPLFGGCSSDMLDTLAAVTSESEFAGDTPIVQQGQIGNGLYLVVSGAVRIVSGSSELARFGPGDFFGELSVIDQRPRVASALAVGQTVCLALASWDLLAVLEKEPGIAVNMLKELARRLRDTDAQLRS